MRSIRSFDDHEGLLSALNETYGIGAASIQKHRDFIGYVYFVRAGQKEYVLKLYRPFHRENALNSIGIIRYLMDRGFPVTRIVDAQNGEGHFSLSTPAGESVGILYERLKGEEPDIQSDIEGLGRQAGKLHSLMAQYTGTLLPRDKGYFIRRYLKLLNDKGLSPKKIDEITQYGDALWDRLSQAAPGFCHGDMHCGNFIKGEYGEYYLFDFDAAGCAFPVIDVATLCDGTDYFQFDPASFDATNKNLKRFLKGYLTKASLANQDIPRVYDFIAIRHFDIQATIADCQGTSLELLEGQYEWLMQWRDLCAKKGCY